MGAALGFAVSLGTQNISLLCRATKATAATALSCAVINYLEAKALTAPLQPHISPAATLKATSSEGMGSGGDGWGEGLEHNTAPGRHHFNARDVTGGHREAESVQEQEAWEHFAARTS